MTVENHYDALIEKHRKIESEIAAEMRRPLPSSFAIQRLKRQRLLLKDEIESWERLIGAARLKPVLGAGVPHA